MAKVVFRYNMFLEWFFSALIPLRLAVQFCRFGEFFFMCLLERVKMKKSILLGFAGMLFVSASAQAISISGQAGEDYTNIGVGFGTESTGLALSGN